MKSHIRVAIVAAASALMSKHAVATSLTSGVTLAAPGTTVTVPVDLENPSQDAFTSIDAAIRILGESGDLPLILGFEASLTDPFVWEPFGSVSYIPAPNNPLASPVSGEVLGVSGSDRGVLANSEGRIMELTISVSEAAVPGQVFQIDLIENLSFIGNLGVAEHFTEPFQDGTLKIVTNQILGDYDCIQANLFTVNDCGDMNGDGFVDGSDFNIVLNQINALAAPAAVPEPELAAWLLFGFLTLAVRGRGRW